MVTHLSEAKTRCDEDAFRALGLRPATSEDEPFLRNVFAATRADELALMNWDESQKEAFVAMQFNAQSRQYVMSYPHAHNSIILWNGAPIGRLIIDRGANEFTLVNIALLPAHRNAGIGTSLLRGLLKEATTVGKPVRLHALTTSAAVRLYERLGFSRVGADAVYTEMIWLPPVPKSR
jgi:ribosomal protein S18 acetylase RimI-like enzyme